MNSVTKDAKTKGVTTGFEGFEGIADMMDVGGLGDLITLSEQDYSLVLIEEIDVLPQVREEMEDEENSLAELAASISEHGVFQPILIRPSTGPLPFELVAGERRLRASILAGKTKIPSVIRELTDSQVDAIQFAENVQRKNLTLVETAKKLQAELNSLGGDVELLCEKHNKSRAWISKWLNLSNLTPQAKRVITENVSADLEIINTVRQVEKADPNAAKALVDELKETRGKKGENAREKAKAAKESVKPRKPKKEKSSERGESFVGSEEENHEFEFSGEPENPKVDPLAIADKAYVDIASGNIAAKKLLGGMAAEERDAFDDWLHSFYSAGEQCKTLAAGVLQGFRSGTFAVDGNGALALASFLHGADSECQFNAINIIASVKA